jgi:hypothetical protein
MATKKTKTASKKKQPKLEELSQTTGKDFDARIARAKELEEVLGFHKSSPFKTSDPKVFEKMLEDINLTDLQAMAVRVGVFPSGNKTVLRNKVKRAFNTSLHGQGSVTLVGKPVVELDPNNPKHKKVLDYLKD